MKLALTKKITASVFEEEEPNKKDDGDVVDDPYREEIPGKRKGKKKRKSKVNTHTHEHTFTLTYPSIHQPPHTHIQAVGVEEDRMETCRHCDMVKYGVPWCGKTTPNLPRFSDEEGTDEEDADDEMDEEGTDEEDADGGMDEEGIDEEDADGGIDEEGTDEERQVRPDVGACVYGCICIYNIYNTPYTLAHTDTTGFPD